MKLMSLLRTFKTHIILLQNYNRSIGLFVSYIDIHIIQTLASIHVLQYLNSIIFKLYKDNIKKISNEYIDVLKEGSGGVKSNG